MDDRTPSAIQAAALHLLSRHPDAPVLGVVRRQLERHGWLARVAGDHGVPVTAVTDDGHQALARAMADPPPLDATTARSLAVLAEAGPGGLRGKWPGPPMALTVARVFGLVRSEPPEVDAYLTATLWLTDAGARQVERYRSHPPRKAAMTVAEATAIRATALGEDDPSPPPAVAAAYRACDQRGWLQWATYDDGGRTARRREVTPAGWTELLAHLKRRGELPLKLPVRALVAGQLVRLADPARAASDEPAPVIRVSKVTLAGQLLGHVVMIPGPRGPHPYPDREPLPPDTRFEVTGYRIPKPRGAASQPAPGSTSPPATGRPGQ